jgi:hypothetical protein
VTLRVGVFVVVAVGYITVREGDKGQKDKDRHCDDSIHQWRNRKLAVLDKWSLGTLSKQCNQFVLLELLYLQNNLDAGLPRAANQPFCGS